MCGLYLASSNNPRKMSSYTLTPNAYLMQESIQTLRFIRSEMIWIQIILIEMQIRRDMKRERYWLKFTNWHKLCHIVDSVPFFTSVQNSVFKCWIRSTAITYVQQIKTCMKSFRFVPLRQTLLFGIKKRGWCYIVEDTCKAGAFRIHLVQYVSKSQTGTTHGNCSGSYVTYFQGDEVERAGVRCNIAPFLRPYSTPHLLFQ